MTEQERSARRIALWLCGYVAYALGRQIAHDIRTIIDWARP